MAIWVAVAALAAAPAALAQTALSKGVAVTGLAGATGNTRDFTLVVPAGASQLSFALSGGTGDADLYVRRGAQATSSSNDCASESGTNAENCAFASPTAATYHVRVQAYRAYSGASLVGNYNTSTGTPTTVTLQPGVPVSNQAAAAGAWLRYRIDVPAGATNLTVRTSGGTGAVDLYVRAGSEPSSSAYDCRPLVVGNEETCTFAQPQAASYYVGLYGFKAFAGVTLTASFSQPPTGGATWPGFNTYYVNAIGKTGVALRSALNTAAAHGHARMSYSAVWDALKYTDEDPANTANVILIYTGRSQAKTYNASVNSSDQDAWNREHVWAKSHGFPDEGQWGYTDIHHLRPADVSVNSTRGNKDFDWGGSAIGEAPGNLTDADSFEPRAAVKGDVARMMFYMAIRYEGNDSTGVGNLELADNVGTSGNLFGKRCTLIAWHRADPVGADEIRRHGRIVERQGNRNPFVDYPAWAEELFGAGCP
ncbi:MULTISPECIES: endonuclease [unclassified Roseateles]|uniref:endonuclease n=1 Tax=unclassified Roseateles TaxID=2626991 RepID=UPI0006FD9899|nr:MULTISPECIES: endonuclease [unclassified Roseateles]KQW43315.1 peptidase [Pelomonas sp. Root405]KRA71053.1 peptidase [Pelomonas sp. Root662]